MQSCDTQTFNPCDSCNNYNLSEFIIRSVLAIIFIIFIIICNDRYDFSIGGILSINMAGGSIIMHEASHTHDKLGATCDFYEPNLTQGLF